ncbi:MAG: GNAT family N-acetyltransferase [Actinobacteria bacterium]|nr:GNAT family N-acetyltransferase [Actinomycetota bacterium]
MKSSSGNPSMEELRQKYPDKFVTVDQAFKCIHKGSHIFTGTACGEPQYLVGALAEYIDSHPKAFYDAEVFHIWSMGVVPYTEEKFKNNFRYNAFFISENTREAVNKGFADYTPIFLSQVPQLFINNYITIDVAIVQTSPPDHNGYMSLGISVDVTKAAVENANMVICQVNRNMPRVHGDTFINIEDVNYVIVHDEPLLEYQNDASDKFADKIGKYVARIIEDGDTIQVGYGSIPNSILKNLEGKKNLGVHTELISDGIVDLMKKGVINNKKKSIDAGKSVATFSMGKKSTYEYINDNPSIEFRTIDYTNNPLNIASLRNVAAINTALEIDLTGQASAESLGRTFYSGIGGQADFMRGSVLSPVGKSILALPSTAQDGKVSRIIPMLEKGSGVTLTRGDIHYVITEYGIAFLHGKNIRDRAMQLIFVAHPDFRPMLLEKAKELNLVYTDQICVVGEGGQYPEELEATRVTKDGLELLLRPVKLSDEPLLKDFFYSLSSDSIYKRFISWREDMPHERLQQFVVVDYTKQILIIAVLRKGSREEIVGLGEYTIEAKENNAEIAFVVKDEYQNRGIGTELLTYLSRLAMKRGLFAFTAEILVDNTRMLHVLEKMGFAAEKKLEEDVYVIKMPFREPRERKSLTSRDGSA